jgi:hypothetical protein
MMSMAEHAMADRRNEKLLSILATFPVVATEEAAVIGPW